MRTRQPPISPSTLTLAEFTGVVDRHQNALCTFLQHLVGDVEQAYDLMQDTFHDAWRAACEGAAPFVADSDDDQMRRWLFRVAYYKGLGALRRRRLIRWESLDFLISFAGEPDADTPSFEDQLAESEALRAALARLTPQDRACFLLRAAHGLSAAEVGQIVGASPQVVRKRLSRARPMNNHHTSTHSPTARCKTYAPLLPILDEPDMEPEAMAEARAHLSACAYCQEQHAAYRQLEVAARRYFGPPATPRYQTEEIMRNLLGTPAASFEIETETPKLIPARISTRKPRSPRRFVSSLASLAAVLVIVVVSVTLFASRMHTQEPETALLPLARYIAHLAR